MVLDNANRTRFVYWFSTRAFETARAWLERLGYSLSEAPFTPCQVLRARARRLVYAPPAKWDGTCRRQGSWYRASHRRGQTMLVADHELPGLDRALDARIDASGFRPEALPTDEQLHELVESEEYEEQKPDEWERISWRDACIFKILFTLTGFWRRGDSLRRHWIGHRANHANFLARRFTTRIEGEQVAYSVTGSARVCSSCVQFFNLMQPVDRKLVQACPGAAIFAGAKRDAYYDVQPLTVEGRAVSPEDDDR